MEESGNGVDITAIVAAPTGALIHCFHGTDVASADSINASGVDAAAARAQNGGGEFWVSFDRGDAELLAYLNPAGGAAALLIFELPDSVISKLLSGSKPTASFHPPRWLEFLPGSFVVLNANMRAKRVIILP
jgi:hypothetical protein